MSNFRQLSFSAGEIAPALYGRVDLVKYATGLKTCRNFMVMRHGGVANRPGTGFVGEVKDSSKTVRLIPFIFKASQTYVLEFGDQYMRVHQNGAQLTEDAQTITGATQANPCVVTITSHGYSNGDEVQIAGVGGMIELNGRNFKVANVAANTFELQEMDGTNLDATGYTAYTSGGTAARVYELATPYWELDLPALRFVQSADVITITHPSYQQRELARTGHIDWTLSVVTFGAQIAAPTGLASGASGTSYYYKVTAVDPDTNEESLPSAEAGSSIETSTLTWDVVSSSKEKNLDGTAWGQLHYQPPLGGSPDVTQDWQSFQQTSGSAKTLDRVKAFFKRDIGGTMAVTVTCELWSASKAAKIGSTVSIGSYDLSLSGEWLVFDFSSQSLSISDSTEYWLKFQASYVSGFGRIYQKYASTNEYANGQFDRTGVGAGTNLGDIIFEVVFVGETPSAGLYNIYKLKNGRYGWIGVSNVASFTDATLAPDPLDTPPEVRQPFDGTGNYPSTCAYYQQRMVYANTNTNPEGAWSSKSGLPKNFMRSTPLQDDDPVTFSFVGQQVNSIKHLLDLGKLIVFTESGEWTIEGNDAHILTPGQINPRHHTNNGSGDLAPIVVGKSALYIQARGSVVRDLAYNFEAEGYEGNELTIFASHMFDQYSIVDWTYQQTPHSIVWAVRDDGVLLGLTYVREHQVAGWHRHDFYDGLVENVCVVPEGSEDILYLVVKRTINGKTVRYVERMYTRQIDLIEDAVFMDSALTYDGRNTDTDHTMTLSGGSTWAYDEDLTLTSSEAYFSSSEVGNQIFLTGPTTVTGSDGNIYTCIADHIASTENKPVTGERWREYWQKSGSVGNTWISGTNYKAGGILIRCTITAYTSTTVVTVRPHKTVPTSMRSIALSTWARAVDTVTGLWHLEGETVSVFVDGYVSASPNNSSYNVRTIANGAVTLDDPHSVIHVGLPITADLKTLNIDTAQGKSLSDRKKHVSGLTLHVEASRGIWAGPDESNLRELKMRNAEDYDEPVSLATGIEALNIKAEWNTSGSVLVRQIDPLPLTILSVIPNGYLAA